MVSSSEIERLVVVETKLDALIEQIKGMSLKLDAISGDSISRTEHEKDVAELRTEIEAAKRRTTLQTWLTGSLSAILGAVLAILIKAYFES